ncbi:MAG: lytic transglycosylase domain-containing protein [Nitrospiraceae bacterium]|nr:lytic transglycosylase domain-containing protein [Nitrospiraceae bacterium]
MSSSKFLVSPALGLLFAIFLLAFLPDTSPGEEPLRGKASSSLDQYRNNLLLLQREPPFPSLWGASEKGWRKMAMWENIHPQDLPQPLNGRAVFLKAWFRSPDTALTEEGLAPALSAFPDLAPLLLWHLAHSENVGKNDREMLSRLSAGRENDLFSPSSRPEGGDGRARHLFRRAMAASGEERSALLGRLVSNHPLSPESTIALLRLGPNRVGGDLLVPRWVYLQAMGANDLVRRETKAYLESSPPFPFRDRALYLEARSLALLGHSRKAMVLIEQTLSSASRVRLRSDFSMLRCRILLSKDFPRGAECLNRLFSDYPGSSMLPSLVVSALHQDLVHPLPSLPDGWLFPSRLWSGGDVRETVWLFGLDEALRGESGRALSTWNHLARWLRAHSTDSPGFYARVLYFMAREEERTGQPENARRLYRQVIRQGSGSPYPLWSAIACRGGCGTFRLRPHHPTRENSPPFPLRRAMEELFQMGLFGPALVLERLYENPGMDRDQLRRYGDLDLSVSARERLLLVDRIFPAHGTAMRLPTGEWMSASILEGFRESGVPTLWALSIARQESRFRERSLSLDGALGVMQLMPRTALAVAGQSDEPLRKTLGRNLGRVRHPDVNSLIGGLYLKRLFDSVPGHPERAIAGYNAGLHAVLSWKALADADWDFFTEAIPYQETRRYVREVLWNYAYLEKHLERREGKTK